MAGGTERAGGPRQPPGVARIMSGGKAWLLPPAGRLTFGRVACDVPFGAEPEDLRVSRRAGTLAESEDAIIVRNSSRHPLLLLSADGNSQRIIEPTSAQSAGMRDFRIVAVGTHGYRHELSVLHYRAPSANETGQDTVMPSVHLTPTERRLLVALCEARLRSGRSHDAFATYKEIALRVDRDDNYVRNRLATVRGKLAELGVPGLMNDEPGPSPRRLPDYIIRLGDWVLAAGLINRTDLILLDAGKPR